MKALRLHARGGPEQLFYEDAPLPQPAPGEARVRVYAAAITPTELKWDETYRTSDGRSRIPSIPGHDVCGIVDALGTGASGIALGDPVYGLIDFPRDGSAAEYATIPAGDLAIKPKSLDFVHAAAVPLSALTAWQALFDHGHLPRGGRVLIHGAAGGVGAYAVQIAHWHRAQVIATSSSRHAAQLKISVSTPSSTMRNRASRKPFGRSTSFSTPSAATRSTVPGKRSAPAERSSQSSHQSQRRRQSPQASTASSSSSAPIKPR